jgi:hypothetical protein
MDPRAVIASRIDLQLRRHLGQPVDTHRALHDARYIKDLLLVCDAMEGTDLPQLATQFRTIDEQTSAARRALAPRAAARPPMPYVPTGPVEAHCGPSTSSGRTGAQAFSRSSSAPSATWSPTP